MKTSPRFLFLGIVAALGLALPAVGFAQDNNKQPAPAPAADNKSTAVAPTDHTPAPAVAPAAPTPAETTAAPATQPADEKAAAEPPLRRLDEPSKPDETKSQFRARVRSHHHSGNEVVHVGGDSYLGKDKKADQVVAVFGSATSEGEVTDQVVSVFGHTRTTGPVGDQAVAVFGNAYVNSKVGGQVIAVFGNVELGPEAEVGDVVAVGGQVIRDPKAIVHGEVNNVSFGGAFADFEWLHLWITHCVLYFRPLAFVPGLMWAWWIAIGFLAVYVVLALLFPKGVNQCVATLEERPGYSILAALLTVLLAPIVTILLICTGVGIVVVPFFGAAIFFATLFGRAVMLAWIGRRIAKLWGSEHPAMAVLIGGVIVLLLYTIPVLGLILYKLLGWIGLGVVVYILAGKMKREIPVVPPAPPVSPAMQAVLPVVVAPVPGVAEDPLASVVPPPMSAATAVPPVLPPAMLPRAGFWIRTAAMLLDFVLIAILCSFLSGVSNGNSHVHLHADFLPVLALYAAIMWKLKGTTVGGIVCGLKVVRLDDRPIDWGTAIVRALSCFLSLFVAGLGFIWVVFDDQRQSWHDKIAGTTVVRVPKGVSLV